jgi:hypothetical protein
MDFNLKEYINKKTQHLEQLFFAHPEAIRLLKEHPDILLLDCIYKTGWFCILLLNICTVTSNCKTVQVVLCFLSSKKKEDYN